MAQLNSLIVTGNSRFLNPINGDARNGVYYVKGTQTASTGAWTGNIPIPALYDGLTIMYYLPYNGSGNATLNLTLSNGTTTGAINCYYSNGRLTTHYGKGCNIIMTYHPAGSISVDGTATTDDRWIANANYADGNSDTYDRNRYKVNIKAGTTAITAGNIIVANSSNLYHHLKDGTAFDIKNPILYANANIAASSTGTNNYDIINFTVTTTQSITLTAYAPVFIKGTLSGTTFTPDSTSPLTQTIPTSADSKYYMLLGVANTTTAIYLTLDHRIFAYKNGAFGEIVNDALSVNGFTVAKNVPSNAEFTDTQSDWNATSGKAAILNKPTIPTVNNGTLTIQKNGTQVATFTANQSGNSTANITVPTVTDTYSSTGTDATSGKAVAAALGTLDGTVSGTAGSSKTLTAFSQTDGKVSATFGNISITKSQVSDFPSLGTAAAKNYTTSVTSGSSDLVTSGAVYTAIDNLPEPMVFKGSLGTGGTITALPVDGTASVGDTYKVITAGTYASKSAKVGDTFICLTKTSSANTWELIPSGDEPSGTVTSVTIKATSPIAIDSSSAITTSGTRTLSHANSGVTAGTYNSVTVNATGHVTAGSSITATGSGTTGISIADHSTGSITGVQASTTTASKVTLGTAISVPNVTSAGSASNWVFEDITVPKAASSATSIPNVTAVGSGSFTSGSFSGGSGSFTATVNHGVLSFSHTHTAATHGADSHTHTAPTLGTAISVTGVSGSTTASHVKSGGNGTAPTLGTAISIPNVTAATDVTVPIKNTSSTTVVTSKTHTVTDNGHTHTLS